LIVFIDDGKTPQGKELIRPAAGFVVKTYKTSQPDNTRNTSKETGEKTPPDATDKVFVNIVQSDKINAPIRTPSAEVSVLSLSRPANCLSVYSILSVYCVCSCGHIVGRWSCAYIVCDHSCALCS